MYLCNWWFYAKDLCTPKNVNVQGKITDDSEKKEKEDYEEIDL